MPASPYNFAATDTNPVKLVGGNILPLPSATATSPPWRHLFINWSTAFPNWIVPQLDEIVRFGGNTVRIIGALDGIILGTYTQVAYNGYINQLIAACRARGVWLAHAGCGRTSYTDDGMPAGDGPWQAAIASLYTNCFLPAQDAIAYLEPGIQESDLYGAATVAQSVRLVAYARTLGAIPLLLSGGAPDAAATYAGAAVDCIGQHRYPTAAQSVLQSVANAWQGDLLGFSAAGIPVLMEEHGVNGTYQDKADLLDSLLLTTYRHPDCAGVMSWGPRTVDVAGPFGLSQPPALADYLNPAVLWGATAATAKIASFGPANRNLSYGLSVASASVATAAATVPWDAATGSVASPTATGFAVFSVFRKAVGAAIFGTVTVSGGAVELTLVAVNQTTAAQTVLGAPVVVAVGSAVPFAMSGSIAPTQQGVAVRVLARGVSGAAAISGLSATLSIGNVAAPAAPGPGPRAGKAILLPNGKLLLRSDGKLMLTVALVASYGGTLATGQPTALRIFQRDTRTGGAFGKGAGAVALAVTLSAAATTLQYRLRDADAAGNPLRQDWTALAGSTPAGTVTITPAMPASPYRFLVDVRANGADSSIALGTQAFGVGDLIVISGQSLAAHAILDDIDTASMASVGVTVPGGIGMLAGRDFSPFPPSWGLPGDTGPYASSYSPVLLGLLSAKTGVVSALIGYAYSSTSIADWQPGTANNNNLQSVISAAGGKFAAFIWFQGHGDTNPVTTSTTTSSYVTAFNAIVNNLAANFPIMPFVRVISTIPAWISMTVPDGVAAIRSAAENIATASPATTAHVEPVDAQLWSDNIHVGQRGNVTVAQAHYREIVRLMGLTTSGTGPVIVSASHTAGTAVINLTLTNNGTALVALKGAAAGGTVSTPTAAELARQFGVYPSPLTYVSRVPQGALTILGAVIVDATHVNLTLSANPAAGALDVVVRLLADDAVATVPIGIYDNQLDGDGLTPGRILRVTGKIATAA